MISIFSRTGGKYKQRKYFANIINKQQYNTYVEPFLGGGQVLLELLQSHYDPNKTYVGSDTQPWVYDVWKDIQKVNPEQMKQYDWSGNKDTFQYLKEHTFTHPADRLFKNLYMTFHSYNQERKAFKSSTERKNLWDKIKLIHDRLKKIKILKQDYAKVIKKYDSPTTMFFIDPPYYQKERYYEQQSIEPEELAGMLRNIKGKFILTYNDVPEVRKAFQGFKIKKKEYIYTIIQENKRVVELVITNF